MCESSLVYVRYYRLIQSWFLSNLSSFFSFFIDDDCMPIFAFNSSLGPYLPLVIVLEYTQHLYIMEALLMFTVSVIAWLPKQQ